MLNDYAWMHYGDVIMGAIASQITSLTIVYSTFYSDAHQRKHQSSASLAFVRRIHWWPVNSPHKWPVTRKMVPFGEVIMAPNNQNSYSVYAYGAIKAWVLQTDESWHELCLPVIVNDYAWSSKFKRNRKILRVIVNVYVSRWLRVNKKSHCNAY